MRAEVIKLDKSLPLVQELDGDSIATPKSFRAQFSSQLARLKTSVAVGDIVNINNDPSLDIPIIENIEKRKTSLVRDDPVLRSKPQVLAANFNRVVICNVSFEINSKHLLRELAISRNSGAETILLLTKFDLCEKVSDEDEIFKLFDDIFTSRPSKEDNSKIEFFHDSQKILPSEIFKKDETSVLLGKSGAGKSTIINSLAEKNVTETASVRETDNKGRHTTVSRQIFEFGNSCTSPCGRIIDMPGLRSLGLIDCDLGISETFPEISELSCKCKFRNCQHKSEPGCAIRGNVSPLKLETWRELKEENDSHNSF